MFAFFFNVRLSRGALSLFSGELWLVGIGLSYFVVGNVLAIDIVNTRLKTLNAYEVGAVAFFGATKTDQEITAGNDYASTPEWNLTTLSFFYLCPLFYVILRVDGGDIPTFQILNRYVKSLLYMLVVFVVHLPVPTTLLTYRP